MVMLNAASPDNAGDNNRGNWHKALVQSASPDRGRSALDAPIDQAVRNGHLRAGRWRWHGYD
jgi:hypothetical protein